MKGRPPTKVDLEVLKETFNWPHVKVSQPTAAKILGISLTTCKQVCRRLGVSRWPFRRECAGMRRAGVKNDEDSSDEAASSDTPPPESGSTSFAAANSFQNTSDSAKVENLCELPPYPVTGPAVFTHTRTGLPQDGRAVAEEGAATLLASARVRAQVPLIGALPTQNVLGGDAARLQGGANSHLGSQLGSIEGLAVTARNVALLQDSIATLTGIHTKTHNTSLSFSLSLLFCLSFARSNGG